MASSRKVPHDTIIDPNVDADAPDADGHGLTPNAEVGADDGNEAPAAGGTRPEGAAEGTDETPERGPDPLIGALVAGRFRIEKQLGEGGIGRVYRAIQQQLGRPVALKLLHPELSRRKDIVMRFEREARAASRLSHPGSVMVFDFGTWNDQLFLAMELIDGPSLAEVIERDFPLPASRVVDIATQLCDALDVAHAQGLLHRDLKPENILVARAMDGREQIKVCDYGLAFLTDEDGMKQGARLTKEGTIAGTPAFMAPEQILNRPLDARTDLYALGCVIYEMLCGSPPFLGDAPMEVLTKQLYDEPDPPSKRTRHPIPRELEQVVLWPLQKAPGNRPQSASELRAALLRAMDTPSRRVGRPTGEDVQSFFDRERRADAAGFLPVTSRTSSDLMPAGHMVLVIEPDDVLFDRSATAVLRSQGALVRTSSQLEPPGLAEAVVIDVRKDAPAGVSAIGAARATFGNAVIIVVGPDEDFTSMTRALELQIADYIPESLLPSLPRKLHRAVERTRKAKP